MSKLSKKEAKLHQEAMALINATRPLTEDEQAQVLDQYREDANHVNSLAGAFFTPRGLATDLAIEVVHANDKRKVKVLDLCAGIGGLSHACRYGGYIDFVCVEMNPDYVVVGKRVMPSATWINASIFDVAAYQHLGPFDVVISNPPFGKIPADGFTGKYTGGLFEYRTIEVASRLGRRGVFIVPQGSAPFRYSGERRRFREESSPQCVLFREQTGLVMEMGCSVDTSIYRDQWHGTSPAVEIVCVDFEESLKASTAVADFVAEKRAQGATDEKNGQIDLFGGAAIGGAA